MKPRYTVYKSDISYFSGKLEAYLRYKGNAIGPRRQTRMIRRSL